MSRRNIVSLSGGKDSTAMLLRMLEEGIPVDEIVFFDTGWEFPAMYDHLRRVELYTGRTITRLVPAIPFSEWMLTRPIRARTYGLRKLTVSKLRDKWREVRAVWHPDLGAIPKTKEALVSGLNGKVHRVGTGWPSPGRRWCTRLKVDAIDRHCGDAIRYIGFAADEEHRADTPSLAQKGYVKTYPLIEWGMTESECLRYCYDRGFGWGGLYNHFRRVSCFCCPLQRIGELRALREEFPHLWAQMLAWESRMEGYCCGYKDYTTVHDLEFRFSHENRHNGACCDAIQEVAR